MPTRIKRVLLPVKLSPIGILEITRHLALVFALFRWVVVDMTAYGRTLSKMLRRAKGSIFMPAANFSVEKIFVVVSDHLLVAIFIKFFGFPMPLALGEMEDFFGLATGIDRADSPIGLPFDIGRFHLLDAVFIKTLVHADFEAVFKLAVKFQLAIFIPLFLLTIVII